VRGSAGSTASGGAGAVAVPGTTAALGGRSGATAVVGAAGSGGAESDAAAGTDEPAAGSGGASAAGANAATSGSGGAAAPVDEADSDAPCTESMPVSAMPSGSGPHKVVIETSSDPGIDEGTIYRPEDLGGTERYPIYIWGNGGCAQQGLSNQAANAEVASHGYFVVADGTPMGGGGNRSLGGADAGKPMIAYIDWVIAENRKPCSKYYHSIDTTKIATNGFSCGGLMAEATAGDQRLTTWMINSSGAFMADQALYEATHGPVLIVLGGASDIAYENGKRDYENLSKLSWPLMLFSKDIGHGGDLFEGGGDFNKLNLAWLNWWLKGDETATGKGFLVGTGCSLCQDSAWEVASVNID
jgi:dienelactone hydrolase